MSECAALRKSRRRAEEPPPTPASAHAEPLSNSRRPSAPTECGIKISEGCVVGIRGRVSMEPSAAGVSLPSPGHLVLLR